MTLPLLVLGLAGAVVLVAALAGPGRAPRPALVLAAVAVAVAALAARWPADVRERALALGEQRRGTTGLVERVGRETCLRDFSRPDLVGFLGFVRARIPEDARFLLEPAGSPLLPCLTLNLLPRLPAPRADVDRTRDWVVYDGPVPPRVRRAARAEGRLLAHAPTQVVIRPAAP